MISLFFNSLLFILQSVACLSFLGLALFVVKWKPMINATKSIPSPTALPLIGHGHLLMCLMPYDHFRFYLDLVSELGKTFKLWLGPKLFIVLCEPSDVECVLNDVRFLNKADTYSVLEPWFKEGLMNISAKKWPQRRKMLTPAFHLKILKQFVEIFEKQSRIFIGNLHEECRKQGNEGFELHKLLDRWALDVLCESAMGVSINAQTKADCDYLEAVKIMSKITYKRMIDIRYYSNFFFRFTSMYQESKKALAIMRNFTQNVIDQRRKELLQISKTQNVSNENEILQETKEKMILLDTLLLSQENGKALSNLAIHEEINSFMFGGHDSSSLTLQFLYYNLAKYPECQEKCWQEIKETVGEDQSQPFTYELLNGLHYVEQCIKETLRLYPAVPLIARQSSEKCEINGKTIPANATVVMPSLVMGRQSDVFTDPHLFKPERFEKEGNATKLHACSTIPFSAGLRSCIGQKFAMLQIKTLLANSLRYYEFECLSDGDKELQVIPELTLRPKDVLKFKIKPREI